MRGILRLFACIALGASLARAAPPQPIAGYGGLHFGVRAAESLRELSGSRLDRELCTLRERGLVVGRAGERCERVVGRTHVGYLPFDVEVFYASTTGRAVRIRLALADTEQWSAVSYHGVLRDLERSFGPAQPVLALGTTFEGLCAALVHRARLGEPLDPATLVPPHCDEAHAIDGLGGRIVVSRCIREACPGSWNLRTEAVSGLVGLRSLDVELVAARAPGEPAR